MGYNFDDATANVAESRGDTKAAFFRPGEEPNAKRVKRGGFEVVPAKVDYEREQALRALDDVEIGSKEHAELLAMGRMMLNRKLVISWTLPTTSTCFPNVTRIFRVGSWRINARTTDRNFDHQRDGSTYS